MNLRRCFQRGSALLKKNLGGRIRAKVARIKGTSVSKCPEATKRAWPGREF